MDIYKPQYFPKEKSKYVLNLNLRIQKLKGSACTFSMYMLDGSICNFGFSGILGKNNPSFLTLNQQAKEQFSIHDTLFTEKYSVKENEDFDFRFQSIDNVMTFYINDIEVCVKKTKSPVSAWFFNKKRSENIKVNKYSYKVE